MVKIVGVVYLKSCKALSLMLLLTLFASAIASAQTQEPVEPETPEPLTSEPVTSEQSTAEEQPLAVSVASDGNVSSGGEILRLEETIRGNKEQPKVLSIVPWQLPLHQRIDRNENRWAPIKTSLKPMVRNKFLKEINLLEGIQTSQSTASNSPAN